MTTDSKVDANRANAQHSTGPRTEAGKAASSQNAKTHGLFSATFAVAAEDQFEFGLFLELQRDELKPQGINEELVFANLVQAGWKTEQVRRLEAKALGEQNEANLDKYARYAARFERAYYRALAELRKLQTERAIREAEAQPTADQAPLADSLKLKKRSQPPTGARDPFVDQLNAEAKWTMAQLRAIRSAPSRSALQERIDSPIRRVETKASRVLHISYCRLACHSIVFSPTCAVNLISSLLTTFPL